jgi:hypothetical protein
VTRILPAAALAILCLKCAPAIASGCPKDCSHQLSSAFKSCVRACPKHLKGCKHTCKGEKRAAMVACKTANGTAAGVYANSDVTAPQMDPRTGPTPANCVSFCAEVGQGCGILAHCCIKPLIPLSEQLECVDGKCCWPLGATCTQSTDCCPGVTCIAGRCHLPTTTTTPTTTIATATSTTTTTMLGTPTCANGGLACGDPCGGTCGGTCVAAATAGCSVSHCGSAQQVCAKLTTPTGTCTTSDAFCSANSVCVGNASAPCGTALCWPVCPE